MKHHAPKVLEFFSFEGAWGYWIIIVPKCFHEVFIIFSSNSQWVFNMFPQVPNMFTNMLPRAPHLIPYLFPKFYLGDFYNQPNGGITTCLFWDYSKLHLFYFICDGPIKDAHNKNKIEF
jgi:hypothetical protein